MDLKEIDESDKAAKEIKSSLEDIENFKKGKYEEIFKAKDVDASKIKKITDRAGISNLMATDILKGEKREKEK